MDRKKLTKLLQKVHLNRNEFSYIMNSEFISAADCVGSYSGGTQVKYIVTTVDHEKFTLIIETKK